MKCYHMTKIDNLDSISKLGLIPRNGDNSKLIHDDKIKVFFSEGYEGAIALYVDFSIVYQQVKKKEIILNDDYLMNKIMSSKNLEDYLADGVYLSFDMNGIVRDARGFTSIRYNSPFLIAYCTFISPTTLSSLASA